MDGEGEVELVSASLLALKAEQEMSKRLAMAFDGEVKLVPATDMNASGSAMAAGWTGEVDSENGEGVL